MPPAIWILTIIQMHNSFLTVVPICILLKTTHVICNLKTVLELHCGAKTWNEAAQICKDNGGHLFKDNSSARSSQLQTFEDIEPWASACFSGQAFWIGLQVELSSTTQFFWSDCEDLGGYSDWHPSDPKKPGSQKCIYKIKASQNWKTSKCDQGRIYICEITYGTCPEDTYTDEKGSTTPFSQTTENTVEDCRQSCVEASCQAFSYSPTTKLCSQYASIDPFYFDDPTHRESAPFGTTFYIRHCTILTVDSNTYSYTNTDVLPSVQCGSGIPSIPSTTAPDTTSEISDEDMSTVTSSSPVDSVSTELSTTDKSTETTSSEYITTSLPLHTTISISEDTSTDLYTNTTEKSNETTARSKHATTPSTFRTPISNSEDTSTEISTNTTGISNETTTSSEHATTPSTFYTPISNSEDVSTAAAVMCEYAFTTVSLQYTLSSQNNCYCFCKNTSTPDDDELRATIEQLRKELKIAKSDLSSTKLKKTSVTDDRPSAKAIGVIAAIILASVTSLIIVPDIVNFLLFIKSRILTTKGYKPYDEVSDDVLKMQDIKPAKDENNRDINAETSFSFHSESIELQSVSSPSSTGKTEEFDFHNTQTNSISEHTAEVYHIQEHLSNNKKGYGNSDSIREPPKLVKCESANC